MTLKIDLKDRKILYELDLNSRQSNSTLGKKVGLSKDIVNYRIKKLENAGVIEGYYSVIDVSRLGYFSVRVYLKLIDSNSEDEELIKKYLINSKQVFYFTRSEGSFDIDFGVWVKSIGEFDTFYDLFKKKFKKFVRDEKISVFIRSYHFHRAYLLGKKYDDAKEKYFGGEKEIPHDITDIRILSLIAGNSRMPTIEISKKLNIPATTIANRLKLLQKTGVIQEYRILFNHKLLGYEYYKITLDLMTIERTDSLFKFVKQNPNVIYFDKTVGGGDFELYLEVESKDHLLKIIMEMKEKFPEIRCWNILGLNKYEKLIYFPEFTKKDLKESPEAGE